jgi:alanyl-tRNA synthetase
MDETLVTFAGGALTGTGRVLLAQRGTDGTVVVVDQTSFHPVDHTWPDQPGDRGMLGGAAVFDTVMAAMSSDRELLVGSAIPVRRGEAGWTWLVGHLLDVDAEVPDVGAEVELVVDATRRRLLSASHTACHLAALAMNRATAHLWRKEARTDALGSPDLDQIAMQSSVMDPAGSTDIYRLGKSLRKKGFDTSELGEQLDGVADTVTEQLTGWIGSAASVEVLDGGDHRITAPRRWSCALPDGTAQLPCGGTHVTDLGQFSRIGVEYLISADGTGLTVRTTPTLRATPT